MCQPFIRNHQMNLIRKQTDLLLKSLRTVSDPKVLEAVKQSAQSAVLEAFPDADEARRKVLGDLSALRTGEDFQRYMRDLEPWAEEFGRISEKQLQKLFPKVKKLKVPDLDAIDYRFTTYLGWNDNGGNRAFLVYHLDGQAAGIEGRMTPTNKKSVCFLCNRHEEVALFTAIARARPAKASPDYYKAIGNYMCASAKACNKNITDVEPLEKFFREVLG